MKEIVFVDKNTARLCDVPCPEVTGDLVKVKTMVSTISCGTERANLSGNPNVNGAAGAESMTHYFPRTLGYSSAGVVEEIGPDVTSVKPGDRVVVYWGKHREYNVMPEENVVRIENEAVSFEDAAIAFIASFPLAAVRKTRVEAGEPALVMGLGILGQLAVQLLRASGAVPVVAVDPVEDRRKMAEAFGADASADPLAPDFAETVKKLTGGGAKACVEVTGLGKGLDQALDCMARFGRVALLGCTRNSDFTIDYYRKVHFPGITLIGAHTMARPDHESSAGWFTHRDDIQTVLKLAAGKRIRLKDMVRETHKPEECFEVYSRLVTDRNFPVVVQFDWR